MDLLDPQISPRINQPTRINGYHVRFDSIDDRGNTNIAIYIDDYQLSLIFLLHWLAVRSKVWALILFQNRGVAVVLSNIAVTSHPRRRIMKKYFCLALFIILSVILTSCVGTGPSQLQATNQALSNQVESLKSQLTQVGIAPILPTEAPPKISSTSVTPTVVPAASPSPASAQPSGVIAPSLIASFSGTLIPWTNKTLYSKGLYATANVHMVCDPNGSADGKFWIDKDNYFIGCDARGEGWALWKQDLTIGDHYVYSQNANDKYEFWTMGTTPITLHNKYSRTDYMFSLPQAGIYTLSANLIRGEYNVYLTCEQAQNFNYTITQSTSIPVVILYPAACMIIIRDVAQAKTSQAEIEVSMEFTK